ncbi:exopolysaccharide production protein [Ameyamaea chiangmaiensis NBRC 103196]|uniref:3'(2'),5'-bisphosphate nucleotidase CysQ n=1 Tax=Ameyamaea chiangmaiensis TaxID=442969 RepID=A0A850PBT2_9PROT|nr:3'(2'),5'-bisphosphate nucleotidase CysQ [Ameyamaea chiangmaiensis]MBS4074642.1 3'(2'),5'-bisphosphate nucleotidase CysQ [Ameyamaea chiangmaiensis]NVN41995.1 3'(2'),5'-bisphosphate nucleotidase CysQ [Ameyamaea chiangmaiensis]GBQ64960.1 exopolysaccharide production protein [Ameyamaea chiangmaiensis NBRC 103196]
MTILPYPARDLLEVATRLADEAAGIIRAVRARGFTTQSKQDASPVTEADEAAERHILTGLRAAFPLIPVVAEEEVAAGVRTAVGSCFWLVDPLDGTREFAAGRDDFTVNIGLVSDGTPVLGAMALPAYHQLYGAIAGQDAWRRDAAGQTPIHVRQPPPEGLSVLASRHYADDPRLATWLAGRPVASLGNIGSAAKFVRVAEGAADLYPRLGPTMEWDTAAPQAIVEAAGGMVVLTDGTPLRYGKTDWRNPPFLCSARPSA